MGRFILRRIALALVTLWLLSVIVFVATEVMPGDVARSILGPTAAPETVEALNEELGTDQPVLVRYGDWVAGIFQGRPGRVVRLPSSRERDDRTGARGTPPSSPSSPSCSSFRSGSWAASPRRCTRDGQPTG